MHIDRRLLGWGVFLVLLGGIPLAVRQGLLSAESVARAWTLWPLLLVAIGLGLMLRSTRFQALGTLLTAAIAGVIAGGLLASGFIPFGTCGDRNGDSNSNAVAF
ncbi:MAG: LiaF transmembrane domain-containing protein, partial [Chloroflexota bacterium]